MKVAPHCIDSQLSCSPTAKYFADCPAEIDEVWSIQWPYTSAGKNVTVSCGVDFIGMQGCFDLCYRLLTYQ